MAQTGAKIVAPKGARAVEKRQQAILAARSVFLEQGYGVASMDAIAERAGISKATVYAYFDTKEALFETMVSEYCQEYVGTIEALEAEHPSAEEGLFRIARIMHRYWCDPSALQFSRMIQGEAARFPELGRTFVTAGVLRLQEVVAAFLRSATERGELAVAAPEQVAELFTAMIRGPVQTRSLLALGKPPAPAPLDRLAREAARLVVRAYRK